MFLEGWTVSIYQTQHRFFCREILESGKQYKNSSLDRKWKENHSSSPESITTRNNAVMLIRSAESLLWQIEQLPRTGRKEVKENKAHKHSLREVFGWQVLERNQPRSCTGLHSGSPHFCFFILKLKGRFFFFFFLKFLGFKFLAHFHNSNLYSNRL